jgi:hypothetical protein
MEQNNKNTFKLEYESESDEESPSQRYEREYKEKREIDVSL